MSMTLAYSPLICVPAHAEHDPKAVLRAIVQIKSTIPENARLAPALVTKRDGIGVIMDTQGYVLTIGYQILEAESIEFVGPDGKSVREKFVYPYFCGMIEISSLPSLAAIYSFFLAMSSAGNRPRWWIGIRASGTERIRKKWKMYS